MAERQIPIEPGEVAFSLKVDLDNRPFTMQFTFNSRMAIWTLNISDDAGDELVNGIPIHVKQDLIRSFKHDPRMPQGLLVAVNLVDGVTKPTIANFGSEVLLIYQEAEA